MSVTVDPIIDKRLLVTGAAGFIHVSHGRILPVLARANHANRGQFLLRGLRDLFCGAHDLRGSDFVRCRHGDIGLAHATIPVTAKNT